MIRFDEEQHRYFDEEKELIPVNTLMRKHGLAPDYGDVPEAILKAKANRGKLIHKEIQTYIETGMIGFTEECAVFAEYVNGIDRVLIKSEFIVHNDICAGTVDLYLPGDIIADIKTTATLHRDAVSWQLSIYNALNGYKAKIGQAYWFDKDGKLTVVDIPLKDKDEIERLFECERNGERFTQSLAEIDDKRLASRLRELEKIIAEADQRKKEAEAEQEEMKKAIMAAMEKHGTTKFETERIRLTYVAPQTRTRIDTTRFKAECPELAEEYTVTTTTEPSLRIKIK